MGAASSKKTAGSVMSEHGDRLAGKTILVTGANGGLAKALLLAIVESARERQNWAPAAVILHCRSLAAASKLEEELAGVRDSGIADDDDGGTAARRLPALVPESADLGSLASVSNLSARLLANHPRLDVVLCCAGVATLPKRQTTTDGFETQFAVNHLSHFALLSALLPSWTQGGWSADTDVAKPRVVMVSSNADILKKASLKFSDLQQSERYSMFGAYLASKLANVLCARELHRRHGEFVEAVACTPGTVPDTGIARYLSPGMQFAYRYMGPGLSGKSVEEGAATLLHCVAADGLEGGGFYSKCKLIPRIGGSCEDETVASQLWDASSELLTEAAEAAANGQGD